MGSPYEMTLGAPGSGSAAVHADADRPRTEQPPRGRSHCLAPPSEQSGTDPELHGQRLPWERQPTERCAERPGDSEAWVGLSRLR